MVVWKTSKIQVVYGGLIEVTVQTTNGFPYNYYAIMYFQVNKFLEANLPRVSKKWSILDAKRAIKFATKKGFKNYGHDGYVHHIHNSFRLFARKPLEHNDIDSYRF